MSMDAQQVTDGKVKDEITRLAEVRRFDFLYEDRQIELRRICSVARRLFQADRVSVVMVDEEHIKLLGTDGSPFTITMRRGTLSEEVLRKSGFYEVADIPAANGMRSSGVRHFAGMPLKPTAGLPVGVFAVMTNRVRRLSSEDREGLIAIAQVIEDEMRLFLATRELKEREHALAHLIQRHGRDSVAGVA